MLDDDSILLNLYKEMFEKHGYEVFATTNAYQYLMYAKEIKPDIFILDINMPGVSGWEVLDKINQSEVIKDIPVVMLSVSNEMDLAIAKGAAHFLPKPLVMDELMAIVEAYCLGNRDYPILLLEDFEAHTSAFVCSLLEHQLRYFGVHELSAAKRFLMKNKSSMVCVCYRGLDMQKVEQELKHPKILEVKPEQRIEEFMSFS